MLSNDVEVDLRWNVAKVEQALVSQVDWFSVEKVRRDHSKRDEIPCLPHLTKLLDSWNAKVRPRFRRQSGKTETRALHNVQNHVPSSEG